MTSFNFEEFTGRSSPAISAPMVTIVREGRTMTINEPAFEALGRPEHVVLLFDREREVVGLRPSDPSVKYAYAVRKMASSRSYQVAFTAFAKTYGIDVSVARRYDAELIDGVLVVDLKQEDVQEVTGPRLKSDEHTDEQL